MSKKSKKTVFVLIMLGALTFISFTITYAKYIYNSTLDYYLRTKGFYFEGDSLGINNIKNSYMQWDGSNIEFNLRNSLNSTLVTNYDISYKVTCSVEGDASSYIECKINDDKNVFEGNLSGYDTCVNNLLNGIDVSKYTKSECEIGGYNWIDSPSAQSLYFNLISTDATKEITDVVVNLKAESINPYKKVLIGEYHLHRTKLDEETIITNYENYTNYDRLTVSNSYNSKKCVLISWDPSNLRIDSDISSFISYDVDQNDYIKQIKVSINPKSNISYIMYKTDPTSDFTINDVNIEELDSCK